MDNTNNHVYWEDSWNEVRPNKYKIAKKLLEECLVFMNNVPNNKYDTVKDDKNHYELCSRVSKFLKE